MRFLIRVRAPDVPHRTLLESTKSMARTLGVDTRNPKWTSYGGLELDIFSPTRGDFEVFVSALRPLVHLEFAKDLNVPPPHKEERALLAEARELFNAERYWESHEVLEGVWRKKRGEEKRLLQGIILVCAAYVHHQKQEDDVALGILKRAAPQLEYPDRHYADIDLPRLRMEVRSAMEKATFAVFRI